MEDLEGCNWIFFHCLPPPFWIHFEKTRSVTLVRCDFFRVGDLGGKPTNPNWFRNQKTSQATIGDTKTSPKESTSKKHLPLQGPGPMGRVVSGKDLFFECPCYMEKMAWGPHLKHGEPFFGLGFKISKKN